MSRSRQLQIAQLRVCQNYGSLLNGKQLSSALILSFPTLAQVFSDFDHELLLALEGLSVLSAEEKQ